MQQLGFRYKKNCGVLKDEMTKMGFKLLYKDNENPNGYIVTSFIYPNIPQFVFEEFARRLSDAGRVLVCFIRYRFIKSLVKLCQLSGMNFIHVGKFFALHTLVSFCHFFFVFN